MRREVRRKIGRLMWRGKSGTVSSERMTCGHWVDDSVYHCIPSYRWLHRFKSHLMFYYTSSSPSFSKRTSITGHSVFELSNLPEKPKHRSCFQPRFELGKSPYLRGSSRKEIDDWRTFITKEEDPRPTEDGRIHETREIKVIKWKRKVNRENRERVEFPSLGGNADAS